MLDACVLTIARDSDDYLYSCISAVAPHVKRIRIAVDSRSVDRTARVAKQLRDRYVNVEYVIYPIVNPLKDLVAMRNVMMDFPEKWGWIVDSDEYHYEIPELGDADAYAFQCWAPWVKGLAHKASCKAIIGRIFKNRPGIAWRGKFGKERLYDGNKRVFSDAVLLPNRYIHFTHLKKDGWRKELNQLRVADGRSLTPMPEDVNNIIQKIHEKEL